MGKRTSWMLALALMGLASPARADLTVSFATDGPAPVLSATVVRDSSSSSSSPAPAPAPAPAPIEARFVRVGDGSGETATLTLQGANGEPGADALERLSILARPRGVDAPSSVDHADPDFVAPEIRRLHAGLLPLLARLSEHFPARAIEIVSGYRPGAREGSRHRFGRALDLRVEGVAIDDVRAFLDAEPNTGVGLYPTSGFVHLDVRSERVRWVDESGPGETPRVVVTEVAGRAPSPARAPTPPPAEPDAAAIEAAMRAADEITLDFAMP